MCNNDGRLPCAEERVRLGISDMVVGALALVLGILLCSTTVTVGPATPGSENIDFLTEGLIVGGMGCAVLGLGAVRYLKAALEIGYTDDSL